VPARPVEARPTVPALAPAPREPSPQVVIGRIEVVVEAPPPAETRSRPRPQAREDFATRHYLRRP
jgi:hypothetical protein